MHNEISKRLDTDFSFDIEGFSAPILWTDAVGLSRVKKYSDGHASLFKIGFVGKESPDSKEKLWVSIDYGKETMGGISLGDREKKISSPVDLDFRDEFFYDVKSGKYYHGQKEITAKELFETVEQDHMRPTKILRGFWVRCRLLFWRKILPGSIKMLDIILVLLLWVISGEKIKGDIIRRLVDTRHEKYEDPIPSRTLEFDGAKLMDFFGYKAKRWSVVFYCLSHLIGFSYFFYHGVQSNFVSTIFRNNFLALCYIVVSFALTEALAPRVLRSIIIKITPAAFESIAFKQLKI